MQVDLEELRDAVALLDKHGNRYTAGSVRAAIAEISALRSAGVGASVGAGWQPIETAPKDGNDILMRLKSGEQMVVCWLSKEFGSVGAGWYVSDGHTTHSLAAGTPTHWQPLPPAPVGALVGAEADLPEPVR